MFSSHFQVFIQLFILSLITISCSATGLVPGAECNSTSSSFTGGTPSPGSPIIGCDGDSGLTCVGNNCECNTDTVLHDNKCVALVGTSCSVNSTKLTCVPNAICNQEGKCACNTEYTSKDKYCISSYQAPCNSSIATACSHSSTLKCHKGLEVCLCPNQLDQVYSPGKGCYLEVGSVCLSNATIQCGDNMECPKPKNAKENSTCSCKSNFLATFDGTKCLAGNNTACKVDSDCNGGRGLICVAEKCACALAPNQEWDDTQKMCVSANQRRCTTERMSPNDGPLLPCKSQHTCVPTAGNPFQGICQKDNTSGGATNSLMYPLIAVPFFVLSKLSLISS